MRGRSRGRKALMMINIYLSMCISYTTNGSGGLQLGEGNSKRSRVDEEGSNDDLISALRKLA